MLLPKCRGSTSEEILQNCSSLVPLQPPDPVLCALLSCCAVFDVVLGWMLTVTVLVLAGAAPTLTAEAEEGAGWSSMRTVAQMRRDLGIGAPRNTDSLYKPIERAPRQFNPLKIPRALQVRGRLAIKGTWHVQVNTASCLSPPVAAVCTPCCAVHPCRVLFCFNTICLLTV